MRILLLSRYSELGASSRVRTYQYLPFFAAAGVQFTTAPLFNTRYLQLLYAGQGKSAKHAFAAYLSRMGLLLRRRREYDAIWLEKEMLPYLPAWGESLLERTRIPYLVDYDDAIFHNYDRHSKQVIRWALGRKIDRVMHHAAVVVAGNAYLAERAERAGAKRIEIIPSAIDLERYANPRPESDSPVFTIGWVGTPVTARYLPQIQPALAEVCREGGGRLVAVGAKSLEMPGVPIEIRPWSEETEVADIRAFDVGVMPLPDDAWERGKCGYKLIQYMAGGKAVIASPVGANRDIVIHEETGLHATTLEEWANALRRLRSETALRVAMGRAGRAHVEREYCIQVTAPRLIEVLRSVAGANLRPH